MLTPSRSPARRGFTLIEMLVTIGIITLLAGILIVVIGRSGEKAREAATIALIKKISGQVQERLEALDRLKSQPQWAVDAQGNPDFVGLSLDQAKIMLLKYRTKEIFPQSFSEFQALNNAGWCINDEYGKFQATRNPAGTSPNDPNTQSSALLYYALTNGRVPGIPSVATNEFKASEVADTDGDGYLEFVDGWGRALRFYRWPTRLLRSGGPSAAIDRQPTVTNPSWLPLINGLPAAATPDPLSKDQDDPTLLLSGVSIFNETNYHTPNTYHLFLIVSAGPDGQKKSGNDAFGLYAPHDTTNYGHLAQPVTGQFDALTDNITNRNRP